MFLVLLEGIQGLSLTQEALQRASKGVTTVTVAHRCLGRKAALALGNSSILGLQDLGGLYFSQEAQMPQSASKQL